MRLLTKAERTHIPYVEDERPMLARSIDAALGLIGGGRHASAGFVEDLLLALALGADEADASGEVRQILADGLLSLQGPESVRTPEVIDLLLDLRTAAERVHVFEHCA